MPPVEANIEQLQDDLDKGNLLGDEAEAAQKVIDEAKAASDAEEATKKAEEEELAKSKMSDDEKAEAEKKEAEDKAAEEAEAAKKKEAEAKAAYEKLSDEEKAEADKKATEEAETAKQAERDERNKNIKIPKFRLDAATARARKAEEERDELVQKLAAAEATKAAKGDEQLTDAQKHDQALASIDTKIAEAMKDGNSEEVAKLMAESRSTEREHQNAQNAANLQDSSEATRAQVDETALVNSILDQLEDQYPMFNENSDQFNADANADVLKIQRGLIATGDSPADALVEAVNMVLPKYGVTADEDTSEADKAAAKTAAAEKAAADKKAQVEKNLDASKKTPPDMDNAGDDSDSAGPQGDLPNAADLTDAEFDALPEATRKAMRGDNF